LKNIALHAVRVGNYYSEDQAPVLAYIAEVHAELLLDQKWLKETKELWDENGLTRRYSVAEILAKKHEADGFDIFVDPEEACLPARPSGPVKLEAGVVAELQEGLDAMTDGPVGQDEALELLEGCARGGELAAAVFCGERLEAMYEDSEMPGPLVDRAFTALKPLLRPAARQQEPRLQGSWTEELPAKKLQRRFAKLLERLVQAQKKRELTEDGPAAERARRVADAEAALQRLCGALVPLIMADPEASRCERRGPLAQVIARLCAERGLQVSTAVGWQIMQELVRTKVLEVKGRVVRLTGAASEASACHSDADGASGLGISPSDKTLLESVARERSERRRQRQKSREQGRAARRQRREGL